MLEKFKKLYFIGIGGISLSAIALILKEQGYQIFGSDASKSNLTDKLSQQGIEIAIGNTPEFVDKCDCLIITGAIPEDNPDLLRAKKLKKPIFSRAEILEEITKDKIVISVSGCHGKTTTTGMISSICLKAGLDPTIHIGGILKNINSNVKIGKSKLFITEACEYKDSFLSLNSDIAIILNIQEDHLDYFKNLDNIYKSFNKFIEKTKKNGIILNNFDDFDERLKIKRKNYTFGLTNGSDFYAENIEEYSSGKYQFDLMFRDFKLCQIKLPCFGKHNIYNALASCACCIYLGVDLKMIKAGLENFKGVERRFENIYEDDKTLIIHDYAHHPTEIKAMLKTCRKIKKNGKIVAIFQPHTFSRTKDLFDEFVKAFDYADEVWLLPIYPAREKPIEGISSLVLCDSIIKYGKNCKFFENFDACISAILEKIDQVDIFAILGAGDIDKLAYSLKINN